MTASDKQVFAVIMLCSFVVNVFVVMGIAGLAGWNLQEVITITRGNE